MTMERDSLVARLGKLHEYDLVLDTNAYPKGPMAEGRDVYRVIGWEGADRGGLLLSEVEAREVRAAFRESSAAAALSRPEQVVMDEIDAILQDSFGFASGADFIRKVSERIAALTTTAAPLQADASAPASPAIGIQAVKALADRVRALLLVDQPASWEERRKIADELESLSALHPAPEAAPPNVGVNCSLLRELKHQARNCPLCKGDRVAVDVVDMITQDGPHEKKPCSRCASAWAAIECAEAASAGAAGETFQNRVQPWMMACFGPEISGDRVERGDRLLEEVFELLQSDGYDPARVPALRDYVWGREKGEPVQEVGGVMVTLAAYCLAHELDMHEAGETELARIWTKVEKIRAKQAAKPVGSALPVATPSDTAPSPKGVSDGVRAALTKAQERFAQIDCATIGQMHNTTPTALLDWCKAIAGRGFDETSKALAALSQEPVPSTAEERAASEEGA